MKSQNELLVLKNQLVKEIIGAGFDISCHSVKGQGLATKDCDIAIDVIVREGHQFEGVKLSIPYVIEDDPYDLGKKNLKRLKFYVERSDKCPADITIEDSCKKEKIKNEMSPELDAICKAVNCWVEANEGNVAFICSFVAFDQGKMDRDEKDVIEEDRLLAFGSKEVLQISIDGMREQLEKEEDFVSW